MFPLYTTDTDDYRSLVANGADTFRCAALDLIGRGHVVLNWTDKEGTVLNILMCFAPTTVGDAAGVIDAGPSKLWVAVAGRGAWAFAVNDGYVAPSYVTEKLGVKGSTAAHLGHLISAVRTEIAKTA